MALYLITGLIALAVLAFSVFALGEMFKNSRVWLVILALVLDVGALVYLEYLQQVLLHSHP